MIDECTICFDYFTYNCPTLCENNKCSKFICSLCMKLIIDEEILYECPFCRYTNIVTPEITKYMKRKKQKTDLFSFFLNLDKKSKLIIFQFIDNFHK